MSDVRSFIPAAGHDWLLPFYDPLHRLMRSDARRRQLVEQAGLESAQRVLDIGCGTGTLVVLIGQLHPEVEITGLDPDPKALARALAKATRAGLSPRLDPGFSDDLPYPDASFEHVFSTFMFHHLEPEVKRGTLREARRVLVPGGSLHLHDFGGGDEGPHGLLARLLHSGDHVRDHLGDRIPELMREAGFDEAALVERDKTLFGPMAYWRAVAGG